MMKWGKEVSSCRVASDSEFVTHNCGSKQKFFQLAFFFVSWGLKVICDSNLQVLYQRQVSLQIFSPNPLLVFSFS